MGRPASEDGPGAMARVSTSTNEPKVSRNNIQVEHIRIDSEKSYTEVRTALEKLPNSMIDSVLFCMMERSRASGRS